MRFICVRSLWNRFVVTVPNVYSFHFHTSQPSATLNFIFSQDKVQRPPHAQQPAHAISEQR